MGRAGTGQRRSGRPWGGPHARAASRQCPAEVPRPAPRGRRPVARGPGKVCSSRAAMWPGCGQGTPAGHCTPLRGPSPRRPTWRSGSDHTRPLCECCSLACRGWGTGVLGGAAVLGARGPGRGAPRRSVGPGPGPRDGQSSAVTPAVGPGGGSAGGRGEGRGSQGGLGWALEARLVSAGTWRPRWRRGQGLPRASELRDRLRGRWGLGKQVQVRVGARPPRLWTEG